MHENRFTERAQNALRLAQAAAAEMGHSYVGSEHLLLGLAREGEGVAARALREIGMEPDGIRDSIVRMVGTGSEATAPTQGLTPRSKRIIELAVEEAARMGHSYVGTEHLLLGILREGDSVASKIISESGVDLRRLFGDIINMIGNEPSAQDGRSGAPRRSRSSSADTRTLDQFSRDLTKMARSGGLDPVIGRDKEITRVIQILSRRTKNNPCLIGEPGVGKTAIAEGLAQKIVSGDVPDTLRHKRLLTLDLSAMVAGTKYRGEFEERIKTAIEEVQKAGDIILFIDELHTIIGAGAAEGAVDAANIIKPALGRGELQVVGATTLNEYRKHIEKDAALERRFQPVTVGEPTQEEAVEILRGLRDRYEAHHKLNITDEAIDAAVSMSARYINDRFLPDKAIDLIDEAASRVRMQHLTAPPDLKELEDKIQRLAQEKEEAVRAQNFEQAAKLRDEENKLRRQVEQQREAWRSAQEGRHGKVTAQDVAAVVAVWTGIPVTSLTETETKRLLHLEEVLHKRVVGQEEAVHALSKAIRRGRVGLKDPKRPIGSFLFLGPTGVGKTELCRALAEAMFGDENAMIRIDMSEYMERHTVSRLIGSPPGYVGHEEGGQLTEKVRRRPYSVVLFDEIEKAHEDVFNILLQIMEDGILTDSQGRRVDFKNTVIVMTSNTGAKNITDRTRRLGFSASDDRNGEENYAEIRSAIMAELKRTFRPEFLNRIDETIVFHQLTKENIREIARRLLEQSNLRMQDLNVSIRVEESALDVLSEIGFDPTYGARPLRRAIQSNVEDVVAERILEGSLPPGGTAVVTGRDGKVEISLEGAADNTAASDKTAQ